MGGSVVGLGVLGGQFCRGVEILHSVNVAHLYSPYDWSIIQVSILDFAGWGKKTCDILDGDTFIEMPEKKIKWSRMKQSS